MRSFQVGIENETDYMAISYATMMGATSHIEVIEIEDQKAKLYSIIMLIRAFRRSSATSEN